MNKYRFEGKFEKELVNDFVAFEETLGYYDDRDAQLEKWINGHWCYHTTPITHPNQDGGWVLPDGWTTLDGKTIIPSD